MQTFPINLGGRRVFVLGFEPDAAGLPPLFAPGDVTGVTATGALPPEFRAALGPSARTGTFAALDDAGADAVAVLHPLRGARLAPTLRAVRAGVRTFHLVDAPGSSFPSNARGALALTLGRAVARAVARTPVGPLVERVLGRRLDGGAWPSAAATLRAVDAAARAAAPARASPPARFVQWLPAATAVDPSLETLELLASRLRTRGLSLEVLGPTPPPLDPAAARRLARLGASWRPLPRRAWGERVERLAVPGLGPALLEDLEGHRHAELLAPLVSDLVAGPSVAAILGWNLAAGAAAVAAVAARLARVRAVLHLDGRGALDPEDAEALRRLARPGQIELVASSPSSAHSLSAALGLAAAPVGVVPPSAAPAPPLPAEERRQRRALLRLPPDAFVVASVGPLQGPGVALLLRLAGLGVHVLHLGPADAEARLRVREAPARGLALLGPVPDATDHLCVADAALCADPGAAEAVAVAQAHGLPVVAARDGEAPDDDGDDAFGVPAGDEAAALAALLRVRGDPALRAARAARGRARVARACGPERFAVAVLERCGLEPFASASPRTPR